MQSIVNALHYMHLSALSASYHSAVITIIIFYLPVLMEAIRLRAMLEQFQNLTLPSSWPVTRMSRLFFEVVSSQIPPLMGHELEVILWAVLALYTQSKFSRIFLLDTLSTVSLVFIQLLLFLNFFLFHDSCFLLSNWNKEFPNQWCV